MSTSPRLIHPSGDPAGPDKDVPLYATAMPLEVELPANVATEEQLDSLPDECLSGDPVHPLLFTDSRGDTYKYNLNPMAYSVIYILVVELLERFAFYGINYTQAAYLTGAYNRDWNADMEAVQASSYVSVSTAIAYTMPFVGALLADCYLGEYYTIAVGAILFYIPGLTLIALTTIPEFLGPTFNHSALRWGLLALWPIGTGSVKSVVNVFGAKQFHPILQSSLIESYYVNFYMCINIGALAGGIIVPQVAQYDITAAYFIPVFVLTLGVLLFLLGTPKYVRTRPQGQFQLWNAKPKLEKQSPYEFLTPTSSADFSMMTVLKISLLVIPFNIAYSQMATTFIVQGIVMEKLFGCIDAASMNNADAIAVLLFGYLIGNILYPTLAKYNIKLATTHKFAIGSALGALAIGWALLVEYMIHSQFEKTGEKVSIAWQTMSYILIGAGEIFAVSAAYEVAFTASPPESKALASATNLFCIGGLPNFACIILYQICASWFHNAHGKSSLSKLHEYAESQVYKYFFVLFLVSCFGVFVNLLPSVRDWVASIEEEAAVAVKTPLPTPIPPRRPVRNKGGAVDSEDEEESTALLKAKKHENYLKYGSGPQLYKHGSFRAGILWEMAKNKQPPKRKPTKYIQYPQGLTLFKGGSSVPMVRTQGQDAQTTRGIEAMTKALEGKDLNDPELNNSTL